jgi:hypothetical protein
MAYTAERRPRREGGVPDDGHGGGNVTATIRERWFGSVLYSRAVTRHGPPGRGLREALDHLDDCGLCCCWVANRRHRSAA